MLPSLLLVLLSVAFCQWLLRPLVLLLSALFDLSWLGWAALLMLLWLFAGASMPPHDAGGDSTDG